MTFSFVNTGVAADSRGLSLDTAKINPNDSGISLEYPVSLTRALITANFIYQSQRIRRGANPLVLLRRSKHCGFCKRI